jgi:hypothetical protein
LSRERVTYRGAVLDLEINALQSAVLRILAEPGEHLADRFPPRDDRAAGQVDLRIVRILGDDSVPVTMIERVHMLVQHCLSSGSADCAIAIAGAATAKPIPASRMI